MIAFLVKATVCSGILFLFYVLLLSKESMHRFNRFYLLFAILTSFVIPLITFEVSATLPAVNEETVIPLRTNPNQPINEEVLVPLETRGSMNLFLSIYVVVSCILLLRLCINVFTIVLTAKNNTQVSFGGALLILCEKAQSPYSFFNFIFINKHDFEAHKIDQAILTHELVHVKQKHSLDILFMETIFAIAWINPFLWMYKKAVQLNHEFLADAAVVKQVDDVKHYQLLLIDTSSGTNARPLSSSFNYLFVKRRLVMMNKITSLPVTIARQLAIIPVLAILVTSFSSKTIAQDKRTEVQQPTQRKEATVRSSAKDSSGSPSIWVGHETAFTEEGASDAEMNEYKTISDKYVKPQPFWWTKNPVTAEDEKKLESIFIKMNKKQQYQQHIAFIGPSQPLKRLEPTTTQYNAWKNPATYGVWINDKKVKNPELAKYNSTDISHYSVSKLYPAARKNVSYFYQVNLMTDAYFEKTNQEKLANKKNKMVYRGWKE